MGAEENAAIVRRGYEAFNSGDMDTLTEVFDEATVWHSPGRGPLANEYQGREATFGYFGQLAQGTGGTFKAELQNLVADERGVAGFHHNSGDRDGKHLSVDCCIAFMLKDGKVVEAWEYFRDLYAWDESRSPEAKDLFGS